VLLREPDSEPDLDTEESAQRRAFDRVRRSKSRCRDWVSAPFFAYADWLGNLQDQCGIRLLILLFASQHCLKGIARQLMDSAIPFLLGEYGIPAPKMQIYTSLVDLPWAMKPLIGMLSDLCPFRRYHKLPYVLISSVIGLFCVIIIGVTTKQSMTASTAVLCFFGCYLQLATVDLLSEAKYSEQINAVPACGPDLLTFVWGGITAGNIVALCAAGWILTAMGPRAVFLACLVPCAMVIGPTWRNYFDEGGPAELLARERARQHRGDHLEVFFLCVLMSVFAAALTVVGLVVEMPAAHFSLALAVLFAILPTLHIVLRPEIARVMIFFLLQASLNLQINGATFYFYTDSPDKYPEGPHFSRFFFATVLGLVSSTMSFVGIVIYGRYLKHWSYRSLLTFGNCVIVFLASIDLIMFKRLNVKFGIPDVAFVLGSSVSQAVVRQWLHMPGIVVISHLCPRGMEAIIFALLAGSSSLGYVISAYLGSYVLDRLDIRPAGEEGSLGGGAGGGGGVLSESAQFENLWKASLVSTLLPLVTICMIPLLIPDALQTEKMLHGMIESATVGSPLSRWLGRPLARDREQ